MPEVDDLRHLTKPVFLIGSGAVFDAGCPDVYRLTDAILAGLPSADRRQLSPLITALRQASPRRRLNIEHLVDALELGSRRAGRPWLRHLVSSELALDVVDADRIIVAIRREVARAFLTPPPVEELTYLQRLLLFKGSGVPLHIFTTNWDLCLETAMRAGGVEPSVEGVGPYPPIGDWDIPPPLWSYLQEDGVRIWKLHGSVDWYDKAELTPPRPRGGRRGPNLWERVSRGAQIPGVSGVDVSWAGEEMTSLLERYEGISPQIVLGTLEKVLPVDPYYSLLTCFRQALRDSDVLVVMGYGWADRHVNRMILEGWLRSAHGLHVVVVSPSIRDHRLFLSPLSKMYVYPLRHTAKAALESNAILNHLDRRLPTGWRVRKKRRTPSVRRVERIARTTRR